MIFFVLTCWIENIYSWTPICPPSKNFSGAKSRNFHRAMLCSLFIYVHEHDRLCFPMLTVETAVFDCICWLSSSRDRKGQSYPVEYCLESVEEYSEGTIHEGEPEPRNGDVNTVYFINQARGNTRINNTEFIYDESMRLQMVTSIWASCLEWCS